jgi:hypothetical protein
MRHVLHRSIRTSTPSSQSRLDREAKRVLQLLAKLGLRHVVAEEQRAAATHGEP